jgi:hypothetical protein
MEFKIKKDKGYNSYIKLKDNTRIDTEGFSNEYQNNKRNKQNIEILDCIYYVNQNDLTPDVKRVVNICFHGFSLWSSLKNKYDTTIKHQFAVKRLFNSLPTSYQQSSNSIYINKKTYSKGDSMDPKIYEKLLKKGLNESEITNLILVHEMGHAIHHQIYNKHGVLFNGHSSEIALLNKLLSFKSINIYNNKQAESAKISNLHHLSYKVATECFADLYSSIVLSKIYDSEQSKDIINALYEMRREGEGDKIEFLGNKIITRKGEEYYTSDVIKEYLSDRHNIKLDSFKSIFEYISDVTSKQVVNKINSEIISFGKGNSIISQFIGFINVTHDLKHDNIDSTFRDIQKHFECLKPFMDFVDKDNYNGYNNGGFDIGVESAKMWLKERNKSVMKMRLQSEKSKIAQEENRIKTAFKNKLK